MQKTLIRSLSTHYNRRWRNSNNPSIYKGLISTLLLPGQTLALDCWHVYPDIADLHVDQDGQYHNVLALNARKFKYKTLDQLKHLVIQLGQQTCHRGRIFVSFNFQFVNFNRLQKDFFIELENWINELKQHDIVLMKNFTKTLPKTSDWGDCFFIFEKL